MDSKMPFGKYKGDKINTLNREYVSWLCSQNWFKGELKELMVSNKDKFNYRTRSYVDFGGDMMTGSLQEGYM